MQAIDIAVLKFIEWVEADCAAETECARLRAPVARMADELNAYVDEHGLDFDEVQVRAAEWKPAA
jgi:hypothetical protein